MEVIIRPDGDSAAELAARLIGDAIKNQPDMTLGLATGRTMESVYDKLAYQDLDFADCSTFNLDEYIGIPPESEHSYRSYMNTHLFDRINIAKENTHLPNGMAEDYKAEAARYEELIASAGGIDLQLLGIGMSGHIGFNEPLSALFSRTREKALTQTTIDQNAPLFDSPEDMPRRAFTMGIGTILDARRIILLATGEEKSEILAKAVEGPVTAMISATALQLHPATTVIVDEAASIELEGVDYYRWLFENEPEWAQYKEI